MCAWDDWHIFFYSLRGTDFGFRRPKEILDLRYFAKNGKERAERKCQKLAKGRSKNEIHNRGEPTDFCNFLTHLSFDVLICSNRQKCTKWKSAVLGSLKKDVAWHMSFKRFRL